MHRFQERVDASGVALDHRNPRLARGHTSPSFDTVVNSPFRPGGWAPTLPVPFDRPTRNKCLGFKLELKIRRRESSRIDLRCGEILETAALDAPSTARNSHSYARRSRDLSS